MDVGPFFFTQPIPTQPNPSTYGPNPTQDANTKTQPMRIDARCTNWGSLCPWTIVWCCLCDATFIRFSRTPTCDRHRHRPMASTASRGNNLAVTNSIVVFSSSHLKHVVQFLHRTSSCTDFTGKLI